jgi:GrpB-like predicted nucleotidyltransferase (UPF0157 family)
MARRPSRRASQATRVGAVVLSWQGSWMPRIEIAPYSDAWPKEFLRLAGKIRATLGDRALRIDHIGSTSVPGLDAKDRIDIQVTVASLDQANPLGAAGFEEFFAHRDGHYDHRPPGADGPDEDWTKRLFNTPGTERQANVHVRVKGRANQRYALLFRDYLRGHPAAAAAYAELKRRLAAELRNVGVYADVKDPACDLIFVAAEDWAEATGWEPGPSDA